MSAADPNPSRRPLALLVLGAAAGIAAAGYGVLGPGSERALPKGAVASVNGVAISADTWTRLVEGFEADTREAASEEMRRRILDRLIEEELLVQRGLAMGLAQNDRRVRADIVQAMIRSAVAESETETPSERELRAFYEEQRAFFTTPGRVRIEQLVVPVKDAAADSRARARADDARAQLASGASLASVRDALGAAEVSPVPDALLPPAKLREYVGPSVLRVALATPPGEWSAPVRSGAGYHVLRVLEREPEHTPPLDEMREQVQAEWVRRGGDRALRSYLDELREDADVQVTDELP
ncbi:MAG: peptidyl-prolyl cis-trans isomerase [Deltaproteobacteria bacterium]|nr:peptidyl-prolyl cis-trans isomerase [Deltaproteobacteria bacterium]